jgi:multiple sugar transport system substrate-binding protein
MPGIRVSADPVTQGSWQEKFTAAIAGGTVPDVVMESADTFRPFAKAGQLAQLDPYLARDKVNTDGFLDVAVASNQYMDKIYAWNYNGGTYATFYNPGLLDKVGIAKPTGDWNRDDYMADATKSTTYHNPNDPAAGVEVYGTVDLPGWDDFATIDGADLFGKDGAHVNFTDERVLTRIDWNAGLMAKRLIPSPRFKDNPAPGFYRQTAALWTTGYWNVARARVDAKFPWDVAAIPKAMTGTRTTMGWYSGNIIATGSAHHDESWAFVKFFGGDPGQTILTQAGLTMPATKDLANADLFRLVPQQATFVLL